MADRTDPQLIVDAAHHRQVVRDGLLCARASLEIATADFKAMLVPDQGPGRSAPSIVRHLIRLAEKGVEIRLLHAGIPSAAARQELKGLDCDRLTIRRCPRLHAKTVIVDAAAMYLGSANLTGAGLGAKGDERRNIEWGIWTRRANLIDQVLDEFNQLWEGARCAPCGRKDICPVPLEEPRL